MTEQSRHSLSESWLKMDQELPREEFVERFGREVYDELVRSWMMEEREGRCFSPKVVRAILEAVQLLLKQK